MSTTLPQTAKLILLGESGVGKTNILLRLCDDDYRQNYVATIGVDFKIKLFDIDGRKIKMQIWDTAGQQRFRTINQTYYKNASGIVLVYAVDDYSSFKKVEEWVRQVAEYSEVGGYVPKVLLGNKCDLVGKRQVKEEEGRELAERFGMGFLEVSAKEGVNVMESFVRLGRKVKERMEGEEREREQAVKLGRGKKQGERECNC